MQKYIYRFLILLCLLHSSIFANNTKNINSVLQNVKANSNKILNGLKPSDFSFINTSKIDDMTKQSLKKYPIIFYLYSTDMKLIAIKRFAYTIKKLKKKFPKLRGYVVLKGFPKKSFWVSLRESVYSPKLKNTIVFKVHPFIYKYYKAKLVPAYIFANCPKNFRFKECDRKNSYIARGDFSLEYFLNLLGNDNKTLKKYYNYLSEVK